MKNLKEFDNYSVEMFIYNGVSVRPSEGQSFTFLHEVHDAGIDCVDRFYIVITNKKGVETHRYNASGNGIDCIIWG